MELNSTCAGTEGHWEVQGSAWNPRVSSSLLRLHHLDTQRRASQDGDRVIALCTHTLIAGQVSGKDTQEGLTEGG